MRYNDMMIIFLLAITLGTTSAGDVTIWLRKFFGLFSRNSTIDVREAIITANSRNPPIKAVFFFATFISENALISLYSENVDYASNVQLHFKPHSEKIRITSIEKSGEPYIILRVNAPDIPKHYQIVPCEIFPIERARPTEALVLNTDAVRAIQFQLIDGTEPQMHTLVTPSTGPTQDWSIGRALIASGTWYIIGLFHRYDKVSEQLQFEEINTELFKQNDKGKGRELLTSG